PAFSILMYGSNTRATIGNRAKPNPSDTPSAAPKISPSIDSSSVVARWIQSVPLTVHVAMRPAMSVGRLTKKPSSTFSVTSVCHTASVDRPNAACSPMTVLRALLAFDDFIAKHGPEGAIEIHERRGGAQLEQIAGTLERDRMDRDDPACRSRRQDNDLIGERDRLLQIMRDVDHSFSPGLFPQR